MVSTFNKKRNFQTLPILYNQLLSKLKRQNVLNKARIQSETSLKLTWQAKV